MRQRLAPMLYDDTDKDIAETLRPSVVAKAQRSPTAIAKQTTGHTVDGLPVHSFRGLLKGGTVIPADPQGICIERHWRAAP